MIIYLLTRLFGAKPNKTVHKVIFLANLISANYIEKAVAIFSHCSCDIDINFFHFKYLFPKSYDAIVLNLHPLL